MPAITAPEIGVTAKMLEFYTYHGYTLAYENPCVGSTSPGAYRRVGNRLICIGNENNEIADPDEQGMKVQVWLYMGKDIRTYDITSGTLEIDDLHTLFFQSYSNFKDAFEQAQRFI